MNEELSTCWTLVRGAAEGDSVSADELVRRYALLIRGYLRSRWRTSALSANVDDACQDVFFELFRSDGALQKVDTTGSRRFRSYLFGVVSNVARRIEQQHAKSRTVAGMELDEQQSDDESASHVFERLWAQSMVAQAVTEMKRQAQDGDDKLRLRVELLHLRFFEELPIRGISERMGIDAKKAHKEYARARSDFRRILQQVIAFHHPGDPQAVESELEEIAKKL